MSSLLKVSTDKMSQDAELIQNSAQEIKEALSTLETSMRNLYSVWEGPAMAVYMSELYKDLDLLGEYLTFLGKYDNALSEGAKKYLNCERTNHERIFKVI